MQQHEVEFQNIFNWKDIRALGINAILDLANDLCSSILSLRGLVFIIQNLSAELEEMKIQNEGMRNTPCDKCLLAKSGNRELISKLFHDVKKDVGRLCVSDVPMPEKKKRKIATPESAKPSAKKQSRESNLKFDDTTLCIPIDEIKKEMLSPAKEKLEREYISPTSPILGKCRYQMRGIKNSPISVKTVDRSSENVEQSPLQEIGNAVNRKSLSLLKSDEEKSPKNNIATKNDRPMRKRTDLKENIDNIIKTHTSTDVAKAPHPAKNKKFKQTTLLFKDKASPNKKSSDLSSSKNYCGGWRADVNVEDREVGLDEDAEFATAIALSLEQHRATSKERVSIDDDDVIAESPVATLPKRSERAKTAKFDEIQVQFNNDETCISTMLQKAYEENEALHFQNSSNSLLPSVNAKGTPIKGKIDKSNNDETYIHTLLQNSYRAADISDEQNGSTHALQRIKKEKDSPPIDFIYKEPTVRKVAEKKQLPGWVCKACRDFFEIGDPNDLKHVIQRCSRHRGRFNPERRSTPPRYWDARMSPTQD